MKSIVQIHIQPNGQIIAQGIDLTDSFVIGWKKSETDLEIVLELSVWPESPYYSKPKKGEFTDYKKGKLRFYGLKGLDGFSKLKTAKPNVDADGSKDWDNIHGFKKETNHFKLSLDVTDLKVVCDGFELEITN
ncbi:MAG: hypothetical protein MI810_06080 [Flavobacteriales bacterium]|nr:hypothetical protein [Flavobacteriales bacterium]